MSKTKIELSGEGSDIQAWSDPEILHDAEPVWEKIDGKDICSNCWMWSDDEREMVIKP